MKPRLTDIKKIARRKCEMKGCPNKAEGMSGTKYYCKDCNVRKNPSRKYRDLKYIGYIIYPR